MVEWPGGTRAFPRWRERSWCTCAHKRRHSEEPSASLPSKACRLTAALALHAMAILQVHQVKALKQVHEGNTDPGLMQKLRTTTDFALRATKVTVRSLGEAMSTMVVQERHLWLDLAEMKDVDKACFLVAPITQAGLFGDTVKGFAQQFSAVQQQTEAIQHTCPGVMHHQPLPPGPGLSLPVAVDALLRPPELLRPRPNRYLGRRVEPLTGERRPTHPSQAPSRPGSRRSGRDAGNPEILEFALSQETARTAPLLPPVEGREENLPFLFCLLFHFLKKEQFPFPPGSQVHGTTVCDALHPHSRPRPIMPVAKRVRFGDDIPPHAPLASPVRDPGSSVRMPQNAPPSVPSTPTPFRCTTTGMSIVPLEPLAQCLEAWLTLPSLSRWLTRTIRLGYAIQFARRPPKFNGILESSVAVRNAPVLRKEIAVLLAKDAIEPVPPAEMRQGFYSPCFIVPKKGGGLRPILDLRVLNRALHKLPFKMRTRRLIIKCIQPQDWFAAIDLKDAYFHVSILLRHRPFLRFAFEGRAWQYRVLPFGLSLSPRVFTKVVEGALTPLQEVGVRILNYLDDWLLLAQSREQLGDHRDLVLRHLSQLRLWVKWEKSKLSPVQRISFLGVELDSVSMTARLTEERAQAVLNCLSSFRGRNVIPLKRFLAARAAVSLQALDGRHGRFLQVAAFRGHGCTATALSTWAECGCEQRPAPRNQSSSREGSGLGGLLTSSPILMAARASMAVSSESGAAVVTLPKGGSPTAPSSSEDVNPSPDAVIDILSTDGTPNEMLGAPWDGPAKSPRNRRSKRSVGACPAERLLLSPSDLPERQPVVLCSSQRTEHGWRHRVPILSERKGKIAAKSCSYAHNRRMSHPRKHLQRVGIPDTEDNDRVHHPLTGNDRNQMDTEGTAS